MVGGLRRTEKRGRHGDVHMASSCRSQQSLPSREVHAHTQPITCPILASPKEKSSLPHQLPVPAQTSVQLPLMEFWVLLPVIWRMTNFILFHACSRNSPINTVEEKGNEGGRHTFGLSAVQWNGMGETCIPGQVCF